MELLALVLLVVVPIAGWWYARANAPRHTWLVAGVALGLVISPVSLGLYSTYFFGPLGFPTGMLGLVSSLFHGPPGYQFALWLGVVPPNKVVSGLGNVYIELLNGVLWAAVYGIVGSIIDWARLVLSRKV